jgi:hypothetical protein
MRRQNVTKGLEVPIIRYCPYLFPVPIYSLIDGMTALPPARSALTATNLAADIACLTPPLLGAVALVPSPAMLGHAVCATGIIAIVRSCLSPRHP